jgi:glycerate 2-kinase
MPGKVSRRIRGVRRAPRAVRAALAAVYAGAIAAVDPSLVARTALTLGRRTLVVQGRGARAVLPLRHGVVVVGAGKGAAGLAAGVEAVLGHHVVDGVVVVPPGYECALARITLVHGDHPVPDRRSRAAVGRVLRVLACRPLAAVLVLLTGGASSLLAAPAAGLTAGDERRTAAWLLASGIDIARMNAIRKHLSAISGGRFGAHLVGRPAAAMVISDVPDDDLSVIGSGPTVGDPTTYAEALAIVNAAGRMHPLPRRVRRHLERGVAGGVGETPKPGSAAARACPTVLVAANASACAGAATWARRNGLRTVRVRPRPFAGDTIAVARALSGTIRDCQEGLHGALPTLLIAGGETTVRLQAGAGRGGRNQELAAAMAIELAGVAGWALLAAGTDGVDGPTDAAGAFADGSSARRARRAGRTLLAAIEGHDAYPVLDGLGDLFRPGPTGTNVADLVIALVWKDCGWRLPQRVIQLASRR